MFIRLNGDVTIANTTYAAGSIVDLPDTTAVPLLLSGVAVEATNAEIAATFGASVASAEAELVEEAAAEALAAPISVPAYDAEEFI